jgi:UDP-N-acetylmuramate dehydrogenase
MTQLHDICLKPFTTFGVRAKGKSLVTVNSRAVLHDLHGSSELTSQRILILGEGSNILFVKSFDGLILLNQIKGIDIVEESENEVLIQAGGGESWSSFVDFAVSNNWGGIENLSLIPGTVGAAPVQNIGAYGVELKDVFVSLTAFDLQSGEIKEFNHSACEFGYRNSIFKTKFPGRYFILNVILKLNKKIVPNLEYGPLKLAFNGRNPSTVTLPEISEEIKKIRRSKLPDPKLLGNAGSFFKNPVISNVQASDLKQKYPEIPLFVLNNIETKVAAGWLIEQCGWKGKRIGDAGVHEKQALVLVNYGEASGNDILQLAEMIVKSVKTTFGIELEKEVRVV